MAQQSNYFPQEINLKKALFLDRDGVVIDYVPYLSHPEQVIVPPGAAQALKQWQEAGYLLIIITNQSGVARNYFTLQDVELVHAHIRQAYRNFGVEFTDIFLCPHHPDGDCGCRKPSPRMVIEAAKKHRIALSQSYFIGDAPSDLECAIQAGCQPILVLTGRGKTTAKKIDDHPAKIPIFQGLLETVKLIQKERITDNGTR